MFTGLTDPALWVAVAFFAFAGFLIYKQVPAQAVSALDQRADKIRQELEQAASLREEAEQLLASALQEKREAEKMRKEIIALAEKEAKNLAIETEEKLSQEIKRRTAQTEERINRAKLQAINEIRETASTIAIRAAENLVRKQGADDDRMIEQAIAAIPATFSSGSQNQKAGTA